MLQGRFHKEIIRQFTVTAREGGEGRVLRERGKGQCNQHQKCTPRSTRNSEFRRANPLFTSPRRNFRANPIHIFCSRGRRKNKQTRGAWPFLAIRNRLRKFLFKKFTLQGEGGREVQWLGGLEFIQTFAVSNAVEIDYAVGSCDALPLPATAAATATLPRPWHECRPQLSAVCQDQGGGRQLKCESH